MASTDTDNWIGQALTGGRYQVTEKLGEGRRGTVYRATDAKLGIEVVVKVPPPAVTSDAGSTDRFLRQARSLVRLSHPHLVKILDVDEHERSPFAVMQYLSGGSLRSRRPVDAIGETRPLRPAEVLTWLPDIAQALDFLHRKNYIHRGVRPSHILFDENGSAYLAEFGLTRAAGRSPGRSDFVATENDPATAAYMALELLAGQPHDGRADQYALAAIVYELLCGRLPFEAGTALAIAVAQSTEEPPPLDRLLPAVPEVLSRAIGKALSKDPRRRYPTCEAFAAAVAEAVRSPLATADSLAGIEQRCPVCSRRLNVALILAGRTISCAACQTLLQVSSDLQRLTVVVDDDSTPRPAAAIPAKENGAVPVASVRSSSASSPQTQKNGVGMTLVLIPAGEFMMGSPDSDEHSDDDEKPWHRVEITGPFFIGATPVTQGEYERVMGGNPSSFSPTGSRKESVEGLDTTRLPVENVSWYDAVEFCNRLSRREGLPPYYTINSPYWRIFETTVSIAGGEGYRLPTEAEWEYACRAGSTTTWSFGDDESGLETHAWYGTLGGRTQPVGRKKPNAFGLYDMYGNVWEWCNDWYGGTSYANSQQIDPAGPTRGSRRVLRGGAFFYRPRYVRSAYRFRYEPSYRLFSVGLRVVRNCLVH